MRRAFVSNFLVMPLEGIGGTASQRKRIDKVVLSNTIGPVERE
jgi:hypothetical protein